MKKIVLIGFAFILLIDSNLVSAHAVVTDHTLAFEQPKVNEPKKIELTFNSKVELGLSRVFLVSKGDKHTLLKISKGEKQGNVVVSIPPLSAGDYALLYKIFAADGHLTEDVIYFAVKP
ncbi:MAG: copper resistance protein CopC [Gammaproteobacteria bacterium]|nr:copper resistance protein CopC [Gammaproteobacteria bacterium]